MASPVIEALRAEVLRLNRRIAELEGNGVDVQARQLLAAGLSECKSLLPQEHIATMCNMTTRTFDRHLARLGASYRGICDHVRTEALHEALSFDQPLSGKRASELCGFADGPGFHRWVQRVHGITWGEYKRRFNSVVGG